MEKVPRLPGTTTTAETRCFIRDIVYFTKENEPITIVVKARSRIFNTRRLIAIRRPSSGGDGDIFSFRSFFSFTNFLYDGIRFTTTTRRK